MTAPNSLSERASIYEADTIPWDILKNSIRTEWVFAILEQFLHYLQTGSRTWNSGPNTSVVSQMIETKNITRIVGSPSDVFPQFSVLDHRLLASYARNS